ncbi:MAG: hypothetical protein GTO62_16915, partial [Planctomycetales bacterium]|nr:hypothetical protein [Planctomycetales bacterium]
AENRRLAGEVDRLEDAITRKATQLKLRNAVRDWLAGDVVWLEELRELSVRLPGAEDVVIRQMSMAPAR